MTTQEKAKAGRQFKMPTQTLSASSILKAGNRFNLKFGTNPTKLVLHFEIDLNLVGRNNFYLIGYLWSFKGRKKQALKVDLPIVKGQDVSLKLPADRIALGNLSLSWARLSNLAKKSATLTFTPRLYHNPHIAYDVNGSELNPSPPAQP